MLEHHAFAGDGETPTADASAAVRAKGWIDLYDPSAEELRRVAHDCGVEVPSREALQEIETSSRLRADGQVLYLSMPLGMRDEAHGLAPMPLGFVLTPSLLISVRYSAVHAIDAVAAQLHERPAAGSAAAFCAGRSDGGLRRRPARATRYGPRDHFGAHIRTGVTCCEAR